MPKNRYYHYDHEACAFVEVQPTRKRLYVRISAMVVGALVLAGALTWGIDAFSKTPQEMALQAENEALQEQLRLTEGRIEELASEMEGLAASDQELYRVLLQAEPISDDIRQVGVGGSDPYESFNRFSTPTSALLRETTEKLDQLERQLSLQNSSYRELTELVDEHEAWLAQMPAILPTNGKLVSGFGMRRDPFLKVPRMHKGVDVVVSTGTPVYATGDGVIKEAGYNTGGFGNHVVIEHRAAGYRTLYAHLSKIPTNITPGRIVKRGELIGYSGSTGRSQAPHLHYEVHTLDEQVLNPLRFFAPSMTPQQYKALLAASESSSISLD